MTRPALDTMPLRTRWSAQQIADAVPQRLYEIVRFDLADRAPANRVAERRSWRGGYAPRIESRPFRIQG